MAPCPSVEQLCALLGDELDDQDAAAVEAHVTLCPHCQQSLAQLAEAAVATVDLSRPALPAAVEPREDEHFFRKLQATPPWNASQPAPVAAPRLPELPGYEVLSELGHGGMGVVYQARAVRLNRLVAIKMIHAGTRARPQDRLRFQIEAEAVATLQHPHIVQIHEVGESDGCPYLVLEYVAGGSLSQRTRAEPLTFRAAAELVRTLALAVEYAHRHGIIHRDLKPANVLLTADGQPKITDFGLAKRLGTDGGQTATGEVFGTPSYMAPEQARGDKQRVGTAADVYALGAILYDLLTGRPPFQADTPLATMLLVANEEPKRPSQLGVKLPRDLETICLKCLEKEPQRRYGGAAALAEDLRRFLADEPIRARPTSLWERGAKWARRRPALAALVGVLWLATVVVATLLVRHQLAVRDARTRLESVNTLLEAENERAGRSLHAARIHLAQHALQTGQVARAIELLGRCEPAPGSPRDFRGFEWYHLWNLCHRERNTFHVGKDEVLRPVLAPDERTLAIQRGDTIVFRDLLTGDERKTTGGHTAGSGVAFSPAGRRAVTAGGTLRLWDLTTGDLIACLKEPGPEPGERTGTVAIAPDGRTLAAGHADGSVTVWDLNTRECRLRLRGYQRNWPTLGFDSRSQTLVGLGTHFREPRAVVWDLSTGSERASWSGTDGAWVTAVAFAPDGRLAAFAEGHPFNFARAGRVELRDAATFRTLAHVPIPEGGAFAVAFSPDGQTLATGANMGVVKLWDLVPSKDGTSLRERRALHGHSERVIGLAFSADGRTLFSWGHENTLKQWDTQTEPEPLVLDRPVNVGPLRYRGQLGGILAPAPYGPLAVLPLLFRGPERVNKSCSVAFSPDGQTLAAGGEDGIVHLWDVASRRVRATFGGFAKVNARIAFSPRGDLLAMTTPDNTVTIYEIATGQVRTTLRGHKHQVTGVAFSPDGRMLATASDDKTVKLWDVTAGKELRTLEGHTRAVFAVAFAPDGRLVASAGNDGTVRIWDAAEGQLLHTLTEKDKGVMTVAFDTDGRRFAVGHWNGQAAVWDVGAAKRLALLRGHWDAVLGVAFPPGGDTLITTGRDGTVRIWDLVIQEERLTLRDRTDLIDALALAPGGATLATAGLDGTVRLWHAPRDKK